MSTQKNSFSLKDLIVYFLYLGSCCFGGPIALVGYMQNDLVDKKNWFSKEEFLNGLAFSKLVPGPLAVQLGMYLGYLRFNTLGATLVLLALIIPPSSIVILISYLYVKYNGLSWLHAFLYGVSPAVIGIIFKASFNLAKITIQKDFLLFFIFTIACLLNIFTKFEMSLLIISSGIIYLLLDKRNALNPNLLAFPLFLINNFNNSTKNNPTLIKLFIFFLKSGALVFGSGFAIIPFLYRGTVNDYHWLTEKEFMDAIAIGMITPGPVLVIVTFIGFILKGLPGAIISTLAVFLPVYLFVIFLSPLFTKHSSNTNLNKFLKGVTAAVCGSIVASCLILAQKAIIDIPTLIIAGASIFLIFKTNKIPDPVLIIFFGLVGILLKTI